MANFNKVILVGNLTRDPEVRYLQSGTAIAEVGMAVNRSWTDRSSNERKEETTFIDVTLWGRTAEIAGEYLSKGRQVLIEGRLQLDQWEDKETGKKRSKLKVVGEQLQMLGSRSDGGGGNRGGGQAAAQSKPHFENRPPQQAQQPVAQQQPAAQQSAASDPAQSFYDSPPSTPDDDVPF